MQRRGGKAHPRSRPLRGRDLDAALAEMLSRFTSEGRRITITAMSKALNLGSRTPLYTPSRQEQIRSAVSRGRASKRSRISDDARLNNALAEIQSLRERINGLQSLHIAIAINASRLGLTPEHLFQPGDVVKNIDVERLHPHAAKWLEAVGLLRRLDAKGFKKPETRGRS
jgi:hypothetical protein